MIQLTAAAQCEIIRLSRRARLGSPHLHLGIVAGGCLDQMYTLVVRAIAPEDASVSFNIVTSGAPSTDAPVSEEPDDVSHALRLSVSPDALEALEQLTLDYSEDLMGGTFRFVNPKASKTCSCGQSFSTGEGESSISAS